MIDMELYQRLDELNQLQTAIIAHQKALAEGQGLLKEAEADVAAEALYYAREVGPVLSGHLIRAFTIEVLPDVSVVYINPDVDNPLSPLDPWQYGPEVHSQGGTNRKGQQRAFFAYVVNTYGDLLAERGIEDIMLGLGRI